MNQKTFHATHLFLWKVVIDTCTDIVLGLNCKGLDYVIYSAKKHGIRMLLSFVNNYADYGGKARYVAWANQYAGASLWNEDSFFSFGTIKQWYKNHIKVTLAMCTCETILPD